MFRNRLASQARKLHHVVFVEDHTIMTRNANRMVALEETMRKLEDRLKQDTCNVVMLNSGYFRENKIYKFGKGEFDAERVCDLDGNKGASGVWGNIGRHLRKYEDGECYVLMVTNGADECSRHSGVHGMQKMLAEVSMRKPTLKFLASCVGLDVIRSKERASITEGCAWSGAPNLFLNCDGKDADGTDLSSDEAMRFFSMMAAPSSSSISSVKKSAKPQDFLNDRVHAAPSI
eukprot:TRINITY_DN97_c5_g1_i1.p1 TRINITY_DN97_c5_g1~~TRINITY_DN97_c5_g1_i1.p1  ORF type:complete len:232 (+),score=36.23 TRINITY_DN97_c5_g1_i1:66-761(+)